MKARSLLGLILSLSILSVRLSPVEAQNLFNLKQVKQINITEAIRSETTRDSNLEKAILQQISREFANDVQYYYNRVDLNGDNRPEVLVYLQGGGICGSGGCSTFIFRSVGNEYQLVSEIALTGGLVVVTTEKTNGWNNLIMRSNSGDRLMKFDGSRYPISPSDGLTISPDTPITGKAFLSDSQSSSGIALIGEEENTTASSQNRDPSATSSNLVANPQVPTWNQFVTNPDEDDLHAGTDFDLPEEFRNGYVYRVQGANWVGVYVFKAGLSGYPIPITSGLDQITNGEQYTQSGQAIFISWDLGFDISRAQDTQTRFPEEGKGCLGIACLTAPFFSNTEISKILNSAQPILRRRNQR